MLNSTSKKDFTLSSAVSHCCLSCLLPAHPLLHFQAMHSQCTVVWWQILTLRNLFYKYMINIPSVTLIPVWSGKCWKVNYHLRILCQVLPKCRPSRCQAFLAQEASSPQSAKRFYKTSGFLDQEMGWKIGWKFWVKKSWQVCELLTSKISFPSATSEMFSSEMFHRCHTFFWCGWCGPKGGKTARWGCPFDFGCRRDKLRKLWKWRESGCKMIWSVEQTGLRQNTNDDHGEIVKPLLAHTDQDRASKAPGVFWVRERAKKTPVKSSAKRWCVRRISLSPR